MSAVVKQAVPINFSKGLDLKTDPFQVALGNFLSLENSIFTKGGLLQKRNGFGQLSALPVTDATYLTTFNNNLTAISNSLYVYNEGANTWANQGTIQPISLGVLPIVRNNFNQVQCDTAIASNGIMCVVYSEYNGSSYATKYTVMDSITGQNIITPQAVPVSSGTATGGARVYVLGNYFVIAYTNLVSATYSLNYIAISILNPTVVTAPEPIASGYTPSNLLSWDALVVDQNLYFTYNTTSGGQAIKITYISATKASTGQAPVAAVTYSGKTATSVTMCVDNSGSTPIIYSTIYDSSSQNGFTFAFNPALHQILGMTAVISSLSVTNMTSFANNGVCTLFYEQAHAYSYDSGIPTNFISSKTITQSGTVSSAVTVVRSLGLASKVFLIGNTIYLLTAYQSSYQPTYFLLNVSASTAANPVIVSKLAYQNGGGYLPYGLPNVSVNNSVVQIPYLYKDLIASVNKGTNLPTGTQINGIYSQTGINLVTFNIGSEALNTAEIANNLNLSGGFLWGYDGVKPVENNFFLYPDNVEVSTATGFGSLTAQQYYYKVTYEWTDNQGNAFRSAPSIPVSVTTTTSSSTNTINVPNLRLTYKTTNPIKIVVYRWSAAQQEYYQVTSITQPIVNSTTSDSTAITDSLSDSQILGNNLIYTTGNVVENIGAPASDLLTLFDNRLWLVDAENKNLLWYSKQVIEATPVEMSDLFTLYVAPSTAAQGSTGNITAISPLDDKLIVFKNNALYFINGSGPDNTGANSQYSQPIFITSTVGCSNQNSIVFMPHGLMFQSDKGIWLLGRDMNTQYIGAPVESLTTGTVVLSAVNVPGTNQVRFTLDSGVTLMYDYYFGQWGSFTNIPGVSSTLYQSLHTYINKYGQVFQETPNLYLDGSNPVLLSFKTNWINLAGIQGYQRIYDFRLLGTYYSPHYLSMQVAFDFGPPSQQSNISPTNFNGAYGSDSIYGQSSPYGGSGNLEQWRIHTQTQKCQTFQISLNEVYNPAYGTAAGAGFTMSGINCVIGVKRGSRPIAAVNTTG